MSFRIPEKQIIVNADSQARLLSVPADGTAATAYADGDVTAVTDQVLIEGFAGPMTISDIIGANADKITKETATAPVAQIATYTVTGTTATEGAVFRIVFESLDGTPTDYQNEPVSKIYQLPNFGGLDSAADIAEAMERVINATPHISKQMISASAAAGVLTLTAADPSVKFTLYVDSALSDIVGTFAVTTPPVTGIHTYDYLKNIDWARDLDFDRNAEWQPRKGATYAMWKFTVQSTGFRANGNDVPSVDPPVAKTVFKIWADTSTQLATDLDLLDGDIAAIV